MNDYENLQELLLVQSIITTIILVFTALILIGVFFDVFISLYKIYIKKGDKNEEDDI